MRLWSGERTGKSWLEDSNTPATPTLNLTPTSVPGNIVTVALGNTCVSDGRVIHVAAPTVQVYDWDAEGSTLKLSC